MASFFGVSNAHAVGAYANNFISLSSGHTARAVGVVGDSRGGRLSAGQAQEQALAICERRRVHIPSVINNNSVTRTTPCEVIKTFVGCLALARRASANQAFEADVFMGLGATLEEARANAVTECNHFNCQSQIWRVFRGGDSSPTEACSPCPTTLSGNLIPNSDFSECVCPNGRMPIEGFNPITRENGILSCQPCPVGTVIADGATTCAPCTDSQVPNSDRSACIACTGNQVPNSDNSACTRCTGNQVPNNQHSDCQRCLSPLTSNSDNSTCVCPDGMKPESGGGAVSDTIQCEPCPRGAVNTDGLNECTPCTDNEVPNGDRSACEPCTGNALPNGDNSA